MKTSRDTAGSMPRGGDGECVDSEFESSVDKGLALGGSASFIVRMVHLTTGLDVAASPIAGGNNLISESLVDPGDAQRVRDAQTK
jgi:hypothetical protein